MHLLFIDRFPASFKCHRVFESSSSSSMWLETVKQGGQQLLSVDQGGPVGEALFSPSLLLQRCIETISKIKRGGLDETCGGRDHDHTVCVNIYIYVRILKFCSKVLS